MMEEFKFHAVLVVRGKHLIVAGMFTSENDAKAFGDSLNEPLGAHHVCTNIRGITEIMLKERLGDLHEVLLRIEARLK